MSPSTVYFITGASRGIGLALVKELIQTRNNIYIFAAARYTSPALQEMATNYPDRVSIIHFLAADESSNKAAALAVSARFGYVDTVLGVAGISDFMGTVEETPASLFNEHLKVNVTGVLILYQAFAALLRKSSCPRFIPLSSGAASLSAYIDLPLGYMCMAHQMHKYSHLPPLNQSTTSPPTF